MRALRESDDATVRERLAGALAETRGEPVAVAELSRRPFEYETSFAIDALDVRLAGGERLALIVKDLGAGLSPAAAGAKPPFTLDPRREIAVYRELLAGSGLSTPHLHGTWIDPADGGAWLFLERVAGEVLTDVGEVEVWQEVAVWSARLDSAIPGERVAPAPLLHRDAAWHRRWLEAAAATLAAEEDEDAAALAARLRADRDHLVERLQALPRTFVHGELYASNVLIERGPEAPRIAPVDWELAGLGPYALDLAALVAGWGEVERMEMIGAFHEALPPPLRGLGLERTVEATDLCRLALAVQWIGWARGWQPPEGHRHDWAAEATELLDRVGAR